MIYLVENVKHTSMKKILGLDLGTNSTGWALVNEAENTAEKIVYYEVRSSYY